MDPRSFRRWLEGLAEAKAVVPAAVVLERMPDPMPAEISEPLKLAPDLGPDPSAPWSERLWVVPADTLLRVPQVCEALGRSRGWVYKRTMREAEDPLPHWCIGRDLVFPAGELRKWVKARIEDWAAS